jgi:hypothetical protein
MEVQMQSKKTSKEKYWRSQLAAAEQFPGSQREFCNSQGLSIHTFQYWRQKLSPRKNIRDMQPVKPAPFVEVEVMPSRSLALPDAKWLAEFIHHLQAGVR